MQPGAHVAPHTPVNGAFDGLGLGDAHTLSAVALQATVAYDAQGVQSVHALTPVVSALNVPAAQAVHTADVSAVDALP